MNYYMPKRIVHSSVIYKFDITTIWEVKMINCQYTRLSFFSIKQTLCHYCLVIECTFANILYNLLHGNIDQALVNSLHGLLNCEIGGLDCRVITIENITHVHRLHMYHLFCNALVQINYSRVSDQYSRAIQSHLLTTNFKTFNANYM